MISEQEKQFIIRDVKTHRLLASMIAHIRRMREIPANGTPQTRSFVVARCRTEDFFGFNTNSKLKNSPKKISNGS